MAPVPRDPNTPGRVSCLSGVGSLPLAGGPVTDPLRGRVLSTPQAAYSYRNYFTLFLVLHSDAGCFTFAEHE